MQRDRNRGETDIHNRWNDVGETGITDGHERGETDITDGQERGEIERTDTEQW